MKSLHIIVLAALVAVFMAGSSVIAQQSPAPSTAQKPAPAQASPGSQGSAANAAFAPESANANQELTHAANEAAGRTPQESDVNPSKANEQEDETAAFKYSPAVQLIAKTTHVSPETAYWVCVVINFAIIAVLILLALKSNLPAMFRERTQSIKKEMDEARRSSEEAHHRLQEIEARLARMNVEIGEMQARAESDARAEEERIRTSIEEEKQKILHSAEQEVEQASQAARRDLQKYAVTLAIEMAQKGIQVDANEDKFLVEDFSEQLAAEARRNGGS